MKPGHTATGRHRQQQQQYVSTARAHAAARMHVRGALGNDIGIMAEHGTNENDERADVLEPGPHRDPSKEGHGGNYTSKQGAVPPRL